MNVDVLPLYVKFVDLFVSLNYLRENISFKIKAKFLMKNQLFFSLDTMSALIKCSVNGS